MLKYSNPVHKAIVPEWQYCEYNNDMLEAYLEQLEQLSTIYREAGQQETSQRTTGYQSSRDMRLNAIVSLERSIIKVNLLFEKAQNKEM